MLILFAVVMAGCTCTMSQVPPQALYVDPTCGAALPDYRVRLTFSDNCAIDTVEQTPTPGSWLTEKYNTVLIRAFDNFRNYTDVMISVELIDTIGPEFVSFDTLMITENYDKITNLYDQAERLLVRQDWFNDNLWPDSIPLYEDYANYYLVCYSSPLHALRDELSVEDSHRVWTFAKPGTTITFQKPDEIIVPEQ